MYILPIHTHIRKLQLKKKKKKTKNKNTECKSDSMEKLLVNIYKFLNFDNKFLFRVGFKFLKVRSMLHVLLKHLLLLYLKKPIRSNKLLSLSIET